ncbi:MAG: hypothetical protein JNM62_06860 [Flavobacteriales bacterium]|nr:hypothetical protein [Flavobacteriales bacterium]
MNNVAGEVSRGRSTGRWLLLLVLALFIDRAILLSEFGFAYVGSDDLTFWQGATDYAQGVFREPYFYGQNYNFMLEALVAVPLLWCGVPHHIALPVATTLLALFPFLFFACMLHREGRTQEAALALLVPIALPLQYGMLTTVSRGFVSGLFFSGFLIIPLLRPRGRWSFVVLAAATSLGVLCNPNSLVASLPVVFYVWLKNVRDTRYYIIMVLGAIATWYTQDLARTFYAERPDHNVHTMLELRFWIGDVRDGFAHLDRFFSHLMPVVWPLGWLVVVALPAIGVALWKRDRAASIALFVGFAFVLLAMGVNKVNDDAGVLLHSSVRMYLALPLLLVIGMHWWAAGLRPVLPNWERWSLVLAGLLLVVKMDVAGPVVREGIRMKEHSPIAVKHYKALEWDCKQLGDTLQKYDADILVLLPYWAKGVPQMEYLDYGCPIIDERFPGTLMNVYERRTWVYQSEPRAIHRTILLHGASPDLDTLRYYPDLSALRIDDRTVLVRNERFRTGFILRLLGVELKRNAYQE